MDFNTGTSRAGVRVALLRGLEVASPQTPGGTAGADFRYTDPIPPSRRLLPRRPAPGDFVNRLSFAIICFEGSATLADIGAVARGFSVSAIYGDTVFALILAAIGCSSGPA